METVQNKSSRQCRQGVNASDFCEIIVKVSFVYAE